MVSLQAKGLKLRHTKLARSDFYLSLKYHIESELFPLTHSISASQQHVPVFGLSAVYFGTAIQLET